MLIAFSVEDASIDEVVLDLLPAADMRPSERSGFWLGQHLTLRAVLRDGTVSRFGLSLTECAQLYRWFEADLAVRAWAVTLEARAAAMDEFDPSSTNH